MNDIARNIGYLEKLKQKRETARALREATPKPPSLHERIETWYEGLSDDDKRRAWTMKEFRNIFGETPQRIGAALFDLDWTRRRSWKDSMPTARYWMKK